jgi:aconitate hydratase
MVAAYHQGMSENSFGARSTLTVSGRELEIYRLDALQSSHDVARLPFSLKVLLENLLRTEGSGAVSADDVSALASWDARAQPSKEIAFTPARVLMQDFTGVPAVVDLAAMRDAMASFDGDPAAINPLVPAELVIDHSVQVDVFGTRDAFVLNAEREFERNQERYAFLRWGQGAFDDFSVVPPDTGIVHQVNLEYLARVVFVNDRTGQAYPDTLVGTDSHTTMVNGLGVLGWGVGGIEAEAAMLGQPMSMLIPQVVGSPRSCASTASSASSSSSTATAWRRFRSPTARRSATCRRSSARPARSSRSTPRRSATSSSRGARRTRSSWSRPTRASRACGTTRTPRSRSSPRSSSFTSATSCQAWRAPSAPRTVSR